MLLGEAKELLKNFRTLKAHANELTSQTEFFADWQKHRAQQSVQQPVQQVEETLSYADIIAEGRNEYNAIKAQLEAEAQKQRQLEEEERQERRQSRSHSQSL